MAAKNEQAGEDAPYAAQTALVGLFGDHPKTKILAAFTAESRDVSITRLSDLAGSSRSTIYNHIEDLMELGVVEQTRKVGGSPLYQLNRDSPTAKNIAQLEWELLEEYE